MNIVMYLLEILNNYWWPLPKFNARDIHVHVQVCGRMRKGTTSHKRRFFAINLFKLSPFQELESSRLPTISILSSGQVHVHCSSHPCIHTSVGPAYIMGDGNIASTVLSGSSTPSSSTAWCCLMRVLRGTSSALVQPPRGWSRRTGFW